MDPYVKSDEEDSAVTSAAVPVVAIDCGSGSESDEDTPITASASKKQRTDDLPALAVGSFVRISGGVNAGLMGVVGAAFGNGTRHRILCLAALPRIKAASKLNKRGEEITVMRKCLEELVSIGLAGQQIRTFSPSTLQAWTQDYQLDSSMVALISALPQFTPTPASAATAAAAATPTATAAASNSDSVDSMSDFDAQSSLPVAAPVVPAPDQDVQLEAMAMTYLAKAKRADESKAVAIQAVEKHNQVIDQVKEQKKRKAAELDDVNAEEKKLQVQIAKMRADKARLAQEALLLEQQEKKEIEEQARLALTCDKWATEFGRYSSEYFLLTKELQHGTESKLFERSEAERRVLTAQLLSSPEWPALIKARENQMRPTVRIFDAVAVWSYQDPVNGNFTKCNASSPVLEGAMASWIDANQKVDVKGLSWLDASVFVDASGGVPILSRNKKFVLTIQGVSVAGSDGYSFTDAFEATVSRPGLVTPVAFKRETIYRSLSVPLSSHAWPQEWIFPGTPQQVVTNIHHWTHTPVIVDLSKAIVSPPSHIPEAFLDGRARIVWVPPTCDFYKKTAADWRGTLGGGRKLYGIQAIYQIQHASNTIKYNAFLERANTEMKIIRDAQANGTFKGPAYSGGYSSSNTGMFPLNQTAVTRPLFHGSTFQYLNNIAQSGLDPIFCGKNVLGVNGLAFGRGSYMARDSSYSDGYSWASPGKEDRGMFVCSAITGIQELGHGNLLHPTVLHNQIRSHSAKSSDNSIIVTFDVNQVKVEALVIFRSYGYKAGDY